jgi:hypothetical protein
MLLGTVGANGIRPALLGGEWYSPYKPQNQIVPDKSEKSCKIFPNLQQLFKQKYV